VGTGEVSYICQEVPEERVGSILPARLLTSMREGAHSETGSTRGPVKTEGGLGDRQRN